MASASKATMRFDPLLDRCRSFDEPGLRELTQLLELADMDPDEVDARLRPDPTRPYGRHVLLATDRVEAMMATWTPQTWCAPHDHGGSVGGVRVLRGRARHRVFQIEGEVLKLIREELVEEGGILCCGPTLVHQMRSEGEQLVTLHMYAGPIDFMRVYQSDRTYIVEGECGAWVPEDQPELVRQAHDGPRLAIPA